jgi:hypothetical protein
MSVRPVLSSIDQRIHGQRAVVEVTLSSRHELFVGRAEGDGDPSHRHRLVGEATLKALQSLAPGMELDLSAVGTSDLGEMKVAMAQVRQDRTFLVGSALVMGGDPVMATAKAVLNALNRRLEFKE